MTSPGARDIRLHPSLERLSRAAAEELANIAQAALETRDRFTLALSGGQTPQLLYQLLARDFRAVIPWHKTEVFWGDERYVPPDDPHSNYRMAKEAMLDHVPIPESNVHRMRGELEPGQAAGEYEAALRTFFFPRSGDRKAEGETLVPSFDLILLGMGDDGHTASLFPGTAAIHEQTRWVVAHRVEKLDTWRITLTPVVINAAANVTFAVSGTGKAERLRQVLNGPRQPDVLPAQIVNPDGGRVHWLVDQAAAS